MILVVVKRAAIAGVVGCLVWRAKGERFLGKIGTMTVGGNANGDDFKRRLRQWRVKTARLLLIPRLSEADGARVRAKIAEGAQLNHAYVLMCGLSAGIAMLGLLQSSVAVVIGAMLISPLMGPIAALGIGFASMDGQRIRDAIKVIAIGAAIGVLTGVLLTRISPIHDVTPEILARTHPNLLDLAVALLSGIAGGYATMMGKGETAIGVAIATALMPPLATVGYGIGTFSASYALGALLLFLTNLSAIAFAFALVARLSGAARPASDVTWSVRHTVILVVAIAALAIPLALTMGQLSRELRLRVMARDSIVSLLGANRASVPQLVVSWPLFDSPQVRAITVAGSYVADLDQRVRQALEPMAGNDIDMNIQQVVANNVELRSRAQANAALDRSLVETTVNAPPVAFARDNLRVPIRGFSSDPDRKTLYVEPFAAPGWELADYRESERRIGTPPRGWTIEVVPPLSSELKVWLGDGPEAQGGTAPDVAAWAISRWGVKSVTIRTADGTDTRALTETLGQSGIASRIVAGSEHEPDMAVVEVVAPPAWSGELPEAAPSQTGAAN